MRNPLHPPPAPPAFGQGKVVPEEQAGPLSKLVFSWLDAFLKVGFSRPLEKEDLWDLPDVRLTHNLSDRVEQNFYERCAPEKRPVFMRAASDANSAQDDGVQKTNSAPRPSTGSDGNSQTRANTVEDEKQDPDLEKDAGAASGKPGKLPSSRKAEGKGKPKYDQSLLKALHNTFFFRWWAAGVLKLCGDTLNTTTPLVNKVLLTWLTTSFAYLKASEAERAAEGLAKPQGIGYGIGLGFAIFAMQECSSLMTNQYFILAMTTGMSIRAGIVGSIFRKSLRLSGRARINHSVGQITTMISTDATRLDRQSAFAHNLWVAPIQIAIGIGLLIANLGYSALVGLGVLLLGFPLQLVLVRVMFNQRKKGVVFTDQRVRLVTEVLSGIRLIKLYAWEGFYAHQIASLRATELKAVRKLAFARASLIAIVSFLPIIASVLSFITYALSGHDLNVAIIFSSLQFFNIIRSPLLYLPVVLASTTDAMVALRRISTFLTAEEIADPYTIDADAKLAVNVDGDFTWETAYKADQGGPKFKTSGRRGHGADREKEKRERERKAKEEKERREREKKAKSKWGVLGRREKVDHVLPTTSPADDKQAEEDEKTKDSDDKPFELKDVNLKIPKGSFVAIVGRVGSGKSSLLQALIGEMRRTRGSCTFSSKMAYVPQAAWIMNATLRENVLFGQPDDEQKFREIITACSLEHDLEMLPHGENTEIGEKGINLSGGQKARVSLARAAYSGAQIVLMDDSLSAVDAYVGRAILDNCILHGPLADKTRILVTHALHVLDKTDYIYVMDNGVVVEEGSYDNLMRNSVIFSRLMEEYGNLEKEAESEKEEETEGKDSKSKSKDTKDGDKQQASLMQAEERLVGAVAATVYTKYLRFAGSLMWAPILTALLVLSQGAQVGNNLFLGFWTAESIPGFVQGDYMAVYAALGVAGALFSFLLSFSFSLATLRAGFKIFKVALMAVLRSPVSFFDTTPMGRVMSRLSKDQDTLDTEVSMTAYQLMSTASSVVGTIALVFYTFPYLGLIFIPLMTLYYLCAMFYRRTSVETKRLDSLMRSALYSSYSETLTGISTVRGYGEQSRFITKSEQGLDMENRAYYMTIAIQRWLGVRLDFLGNILILGIALFAAGFRATVSPSKIGVVLSYTLSITQTFSSLVSTYAQNEQNFNAVERVLHYTELPSEGEWETPNDPPPSWPEQGQVEFKNVELAYRPGLPLVLKGVDFSVRPGEKVGIVGRTGAGKSSLLQALFRMVDVTGGAIEIDGHNIADIGLHVLRSRLALVPQDSVLFKGTLRENIDPENTRTDAELISALQRSWLLPKDGKPDPVTEAKFSLNASISDEGSNYSAGEKQLLALCRALVKNSRVIVLDEATSNVDVETDAKVQKTIQTEFASSTLMCIAHRLNTIVYYDRIIVMDAGQVAEFDTPLNLFDKEGSIFRTLCNEAGLARQDILRIRATGAVNSALPSDAGHSENE
ncbi:multidrug resistance-associated ABC transporter [Obba rivulosa]|uniref:Multidrug resistance-associated ABC transporter n=1 Tax=Obba rivulosa TaxID=1052685 RepID=A0A8E2ATS4_9APHY|nr:multidrug resistance-associated ABC transporter [Obba rivulosa]